MPFNVPLTQIVGDALFATRHDQALRNWVNDFTPGAAQTVLTEAGLVYNLDRNDCVILTTMLYGITTLNDNCHFELGYTDQPDGAGTFTPITPHRHQFTGGAIAGQADQVVQFSPPHKVCYSDGARSITFRVLANDANCEITVSYHGWVETEQ